MALGAHPIARAQVPSSEAPGLAETADSSRDSKIPALDPKIEMCLRMS